MRGIGASKTEQDFLNGRLIPRLARPARRDGGIDDVIPRSKKDACVLVVDLLFECVAINQKVCAVSGPSGVVDMNEEIKAVTTGLICVFSSEIQQIGDQDGRPSSTFTQELLS